MRSGSSRDVMCYESNYMDSPNSTAFFLSSSGGIRGAFSKVAKVPFRLKELGALIKLQACLQKMHGAAVLTLLKATSGNLQKEVVKATHEEVIGEKSLLEVGSCWSFSDQPVHGDCREGGGWTESALSSVDLQPGILESERGELQTDIIKDLESGNAIQKSGCRKEEQQVWDNHIVDELVCTLVSQLHLPPGSSTSCSQKGEQQEDALTGKTSTPCLDSETLKVATSPYVEDSKGSLSTGSPEHAVSSVDCHDGPLKLISALRGGYEKSGLGHRPRMHVSWAPDVYDPPCTSTSHTSNQNRRRHHHHHPKDDHKSRHKGKGGSRTDSQKKSQKKLSRRLKHVCEPFSSGSNAFSQRGQQSSTLRLGEYIATPNFDDLTLKGSRVSPFISLQKACFLNPVLSLGECELVTLDKFQGCHPRHMQTHKLFV